MIRDRGAFVYTFFEEVYLGLEDLEVHIIDVTDGINQTKIKELLSRPERVTWDCYKRELFIYGIIGYARAMNHTIVSRAWWGLGNIRRFWFLLG